jgi:carboxylesterase
MRPIFQNPQLDGATFSLHGTRDTGVLLFHGFTATTVEVRPLAEYLNQAGYFPAAPLLPGHGTTPEQALKIHRQDWLSTADNAYQKMATQVPKVVVGGESMGALLALHLAKIHPEILGVLLFAPAIKIKNLWQAPLIAPFIRIRPKDYLPDEDQTQDVLPWQGYNVLPVPALAQFYRLPQQGVRDLESIQQPVLIFQGGKDKTVEPHGAIYLQEKLSSNNKEIIWLDNSGHALLLGVDYPEVYRKSLEFIELVTK